MNVDMNTPMAMIEFLENVTRDELEDAIQDLKAFINDFSKPMEKRRIAKMILPVLRKELKQFG